MGAARLCLQAFAAVVLLVGLTRVAASEDDVIPRLTFPYSKCLIAAPYGTPYDPTNLHAYPDVTMVCGGGGGGVSSRVMHVQPQGNTQDILYTHVSCWDEKHRGCGLLTAV